jgi:hypothetical protein
MGAVPQSEKQKNGGEYAEIFEFQIANDAAKSGLSTVSSTTRSKLSGFIDTANSKLSSVVDTESIHFFCGVTDR